MVIRRRNTLIDENSKSTDRKPGKFPKKYLIDKGGSISLDLSQKNVLSRLEQIQKR